MMPPDRTIAIIGAGITGLACAYRLLALGLLPVVLEASDRVGGRIRTLREDAYTFEAGANTLLPSSDATLGLIEALGLGEDLVQPAPEAARRYIHFHGRLEPAPMSPAAALRSPLLGPAWVAQALLDLLRRRPASAPEDELVEAFIQRRLGRRVLENLVAPFLRGIYAGDPARLEARSVLPKLVAAERGHGSILRGLIAARLAGRRQRPRRHPGIGAVTFSQGLEMLPERLAARLSAHVRLNAPVEQITLDTRGCALALGSGGIVRCQQVAIAVDPPAAAALVRPLPGGEAVAADLLAIESAPLAVVGLAFARSAIAHPLDGFGYLAGPGATGPVLGCLFRSATFPQTAPQGMALLTVFIGGAGTAPEMLDALDDAALVALATGEVSARLGISGQPSRVFLQRWPRAIAQFNRGHARRVERISAWSNGGRVRVISSSVHGVSLDECIANAHRQAEEMARSPTTAGETAPGIERRGDEPGVPPAATGPLPGAGSALTTTASQGA